eukprot:TRINITY_DN11261_c0_g1_i1.p1 TRINITY_DN11261_c0_g1~~TRINITY_DN11261_c0_g1_i1.p1  ORF type:complete len:303 (-),score=79.46 TRINITY_DN11261_c0_g1_i1:20-886(-)
METTINAAVVKYLEKLSQLNHDLVQTLAPLKAQLDVSDQDVVQAPVLESVFSEGLQKLGVNFEWSDDLEERFENYKNLLEQRGYFSDESKYDELVLKARQRFFARFAPYMNLKTQEEKNTQAEIEKNKGNDFVRSGNYEEAVECYTTAIFLNPSVHFYYGNRSAAYYHLGKYDNVISDAKEAIKLEPTYIRAYNRLGLAYIEKEDYQSALDTFSSGLVHSPYDKELYKGAELARSNLQEGGDAVDMGQALENFMNTPQARQMAEEMMSNPDFINNMMSMFGGAPPTQQ